MVLFNGDGGSLSILLREGAHVPPEVHAFVETQTTRGDQPMKVLDNFKDHELVGIVANVVGRSPAHMSDGIPDDRTAAAAAYVMCPDNVMKMCSIYLRVVAGVPCVLMGHAGCGKTSLVRFLAENVCGAPFEKLDVHAGVSADQIEDFVRKAEFRAEVLGCQVWVFLDEINTCGSLELIAEILCHKSMHGRPLHPGCVFLAACNPYERRPEEDERTVGLDRHMRDELSCLTYRVHPLTENLLLHVWDYGALDSVTEEKYIRSMVAHANIPNFHRDDLDKLVQLLCTSQKFTQEHAGGRHAVSLRDVTRCLALIRFFLNLFTKRQACGGYLQVRQATFFGARRSERSVVYEPFVRPSERAVLLALAITYHSRISSDEIRREYRIVIARTLGHRLTSGDFSQVIQVSLTLCRLCCNI